MPERNLPNWLDAYMIYTAESESPDIFHKWVALSTIAGAIRRKAHFPMGYFNIYPNLYVVLTSPPGRCKKSTAMRIGRTFLEDVPEINFTVDSQTRERLILDMSGSHKDGHSSVTAFSSEFASFFSSSGAEMIVFLTDIYESPPVWEHRSKMGGAQKIVAPYLNMIAGTTPDWIARGMPVDTVGIGLTSRVVFVYSDEPRIRDPFPKLSESQVALGKLLTADLITISNIAGRYTLAPDAEAFYKEWYVNRATTDNPTGDPRLSGYYERKPMHILKVAMGLTACETNDLVIPRRALEGAFKVLAEAEQHMPRVFAAVGKNPFAADIEAVATAIRDAGDEGLSLGELLVRFRHSVRKQELEETLDTLRIMKAIVVLQSTDGPVYYRNKNWNPLGFE